MAAYPKRLFHALVVSGVALTAATFGCGGAVGGGSKADAAGGAATASGSDHPDAGAAHGGEDAAAVSTPDAAIAFDAGVAAFDSSYGNIAPACLSPGCPGWVDAQAAQDAAQDTGMPYINIR